MLFARYPRLSFYTAVVAAAMQVLVDKASGWQGYGWGFTHGWSGETHLCLSFVFYGAVGWFCLIAATRCWKSALPLFVKAACGLLLISSALVGIGFAMHSLVGQMTSAHYQGPEHRLATVVGLAVLIMFATVGYAVQLSEKRQTSR